MWRSPGFIRPESLVLFPFLDQHCTRGRDHALLNPRKTLDVWCTCANHHHLVTHKTSSPNFLKKSLCCWILGFCTVRKTVCFRVFYGACYTVSSQRLKGQTPHRNQDIGPKGWIVCHFMEFLYFYPPSPVKKTLLHKTHSMTPENMKFFSTSEWAQDLKASLESLDSMEKWDLELFLFFKRFIYF